MVEALSPAAQWNPSHDTFARVFARLEPDAFRTCFLAWLSEVQEQIGRPLASQLVAIDGKAARHSFDRAIDRGPLHIVSAWATAAHLVLGQIAVDQKSNGITAIPTLLELLELAGCVVTIDAMGTQKEIAKTIREQEAGYVLALKDNQGTLHEDVALLFEWADAQQYRDVVHRTYETHNPGHGREERRRMTVTNDHTGLRGYEDWVGLQTVAIGEAWRTQGDAVSYEQRDYISSLGLDAKRMAESVQGHWAIEHAHHCVLDIAYTHGDHDGDWSLRSAVLEAHFMYVKLLLVGAILPPGKRTVTAALHVMGKGAEAHFQNYYRVLNRVQWSSLEASRRLLGLLLDAFAPDGPVVMGIDETIERRRGERIAAKGIYRDPVRSSHAHFVKASGLRWVCLAVLARIPWVDRVWALPFLTGLAPSERYYQVHGRHPKSLLDRARQRVRLVRRWVPTRELVVVGDSTYAALEWLDAVRDSACVITRLRLDAALYAPAPPRKPKQNGRPRKKGRRLPTLADQGALELGEGSHRRQHEVRHGRSSPVKARCSLTNSMRTPRAVSFCTLRRRSPRLHARRSTLCTTTPKASPPRVAAPLGGGTPQRRDWPLSPPDPRLGVSSRVP